LNLTSAIGAKEAGFSPKAIKAFPGSEAGLAGLLATVKEQAAQIEKVSAQVQLRKPIQSLARNIL
jgi:hypothetical protein